MYWVEVRSTVQRKGEISLIRLDSIKHHTGFRSVFAYDDETVIRIMEQKSTQGLKNTPVYADTLFMDFDGHDPTDFRKFLDEQRLSYLEYDSGNRSVHFHVFLEPIFGSWVPKACKDWVKKHAPTADISFYHPAGMYRLPGTYHAKRPGRSKTLTNYAVGSFLQSLRLYEPNSDRTTITPQDASTLEDLFTLLTQTKIEGSRRPFIWRLAVTAYEAGLDQVETLEHIRWWNERFCFPPHTDEVLQKQVESALKYVGNHGN
jgi:hypothetical protein